MMKREKKEGYTRDSKKNDQGTKSHLVQSDYKPRVTLMYDNINDRACLCLMTG